MNENVNRRRLLSCEGVRIGDLIVPSFDVYTGDYIGLCLPVDHGDKWPDLMLSLGSVSGDNGVHIDGIVSVLPPYGLELQWESQGCRSVLDLALTMKISPTLIDQILADLKLNPATLYSQIKLSDRLVFHLKVSKARGVDLVIFSTAGMSPHGVAKVAAETSRMLDNCAAVDVFSKALRISNSQICSYTKILSCENA